jgi:hypothetical protein
MRTIEHLPAPKTYLGKAEETLICKTCDKEWTRISRRGRKPKLCTECREAEVQAKAERVAKVKSPSLEDQQARMAVARDARAQQAQEAAVRASQARSLERQRTIERLPDVAEMWNAAFAFACEVNTPAAWNRCESLLNSYVAGKRSL